MHALVTIAQPYALLDGLADPLAAAGALLAVAGAFWAVSRVPLGDEQMRPFLLGGAALVLLYLAQRRGRDAGRRRAGRADRAERAVGRRGRRHARASGCSPTTGCCAAPALALLAVTATKVFLYDLASLTSLYRVGSLIGLGLLLLCGAFAWQKVRPQGERIRPTLGALTQPPHPPRPATSDDEELLEAETTAILSEYSDAQRLLRVQDELRAGFTALSHVGKAVSIFGSARTPRDHPRYEAARTLARQLGEEGYAIITGGGPGIMEAANRGAKEAGAISVGLGIELPMEQGMNEYVDVGVNFHYFFTRKVMFVRYASGFVVFPGGFGTLDEAFEAATLRQTEKIRYFPIVLFDSGYWSGLTAWLEDTMLREGNINESDVEALHVTDSFEDVRGILDARRAPAPAPGRRAKAA